MRVISRAELVQAIASLGLTPTRAAADLAAVGDDRAVVDLGDEDGSVVAYFSDLIDQRANFERLLFDLRARESEVVAGAIARARTLLPPSVRLDEVRLVFVPLGLDFRTDAATVFMDPRAAVDLGLDGVASTLAHELHHVGRYRFSGENLTLMRPHPTGSPREMADLVRRWAAWLEAEGIADAVSNVTETDVPILHAAVERRRRQLREYPTLLQDALREIDRAADYATETDLAGLDAVAGRLLELAHPIGARMAEVVLRAAGRRGLVECVGAPGRFVARYNAAASAAGVPVFGERFMRWLDA